VLGAAFASACLPRSSARRARGGREGERARRSARGGRDAEGRDERPAADPARERPAAPFAGTSTVRFAPIVLEHDTGATIQIATGLDGTERVVKLANVELVGGAAVELVGAAAEAAR
jgi:hypothetical protein